MKFKPLKKLFLCNTVIFFVSFLFFIIFPEVDILFSSFFFEDSLFISEKYTSIKYFRSFLKNFMIFIPLIALIILLFHKANKKQKVKSFLNLRMKFVLIGLILGPIVGCGVIANWYFKDSWGRARPVHIEEFGGDKIFTPAFVKSDQCIRNCSWISGEGSAAFSFMVGTILLKNHVFFLINIFLGLFVSFCRIAMGGHFLSDNLFAMIFMIYLAILYKNIIYICLKKKLFNVKSTRYNR
jgi:lipid A 4'-phosphatase